MTFLPRRVWLSKRFGATVTRSEIILLDRMAKEGFRFKSQWRIQTKHGRFKVDFLVTGWKNFERELVVEVRGESHYSNSGIRKDEFKTKELTEAGYPLLWVEDRDVRKNLDEVIERIRYAVINGVDSKEMMVKAGVHQYDY